MTEECAGTSLPVPSPGGQRCPFCEQPVTAYVTGTGYALPIHPAREFEPEEVPEHVLKALDAMVAEHEDRR